VTPLVAVRPVLHGLGLTIRGSPSRQLGHITPIDLHLAACPGLRAHPTSLNVGGGARTPPKSGPGCHTEREARSTCCCGGGPAEQTLKLRTQIPALGTRTTSNLFVPLKPAGTGGRQQVLGSLRRWRFDHAPAFVAKLHQRASRAAATPHEHCEWRTAVVRTGFLPHGSRNWPESPSAGSTASHQAISHTPENSAQLLSNVPSELIDDASPHYKRFRPPHLNGRPVSATLGPACAQNLF